MFVVVLFLSGTSFAQILNYTLDNILIFNFKNTYCVDR